jgi:plasmid stability protein
MKRQLTLMVDEDVIETLGRRAFAENRSMSAVARDALESFLFSEVKIVFVRTEVAAHVLE